MMDNRSPLIQKDDSGVEHYESTSCIQDSDGSSNEPSSSGTRKGQRVLTERDKVFIAVTGVGLLVTIGFTIYRMIVIDAKEQEFVFSVVIIVTALFCIFYLLHGIYCERPFEILILLVATILVTAYLIVNYVGKPEGSARVIRLIVTCGVGLEVFSFGILIFKEYLSTGKYLFDTVGASAPLQNACKILYFFQDLLKLDLQLEITMVILITMNDTTIQIYEIVLLGLGIVITVGWFISGNIMVRYESKIMTFVFWVLSVFQFAFVVYKIIKASEHLTSNPALAPCSLTAGVIDILTHGSACITSYLVYKEYGNGLKEKVYGRQVN